MYRLKIKNDRGEIYELTHDREHFTVLSVSGLTLPQCSVNVSESGTTDGGEYSSSHLSPRNIVITAAPEGDIETNRQRLYRMFPLHKPVTIYYRTYNRDLHIDGYVETIDGSLFEQRETLQISVICPDPYFRDSAPVTAQTADGVCRIQNSGDVPVGFVAEVAITSDTEPTLAIEAVQSASPSELRAHDALLNNAMFRSLDFDASTVNVFVNGALRDPSEYTADLVEMSGKTELWLRSSGISLVNAQVSIEIISVAGQDITDMRYWASEHFVQNYYVTIDGVPSWYDPENDCIVWAYVSGAVGAALPKSVQATQKSDGTFSLQVEFYDTVLTNRIELRIYHSMSGNDVSTATIVRDVLNYALGAYTSYIDDPDMPAYDSSKDILNVYMGDTLLEDTDYSFDTMTMRDSSTVLHFYLTGDKTINNRITFETISSINGDDIREYTQEQLDEGLCIVDGLTLTNTTTGDSMAFRGTQFRDGDRIEISTVPGDLHAVIKESTWAPEGKSLMHDVLKSGSFFKLARGANDLELTAATNASYASASFTAQQRYGGV